ncbi:hypothetical protein GP486_001886 [Trichoglossum hirsutum]|uniref:Ankyrin repeat protein n=1 Tax=Trichoglossum hirsutum TaxID=265104 RepID=A0A9P8LG97_9PEZI|nr:hypothetical protein GP486_001886 [Trichoglossum hirsutum]
MSFGYSVGDVAFLGQLAWKAYRSCKDAPGSFENISHEILSLHALLKEIEENFSAETLSSTSQARLKTIGDGCYNVLEELQSLADKYESLGTQSKRTWDRMKWGSNDIADLRSRLTTNTLLLTAFMSTTQVVIEKKLDKFLREFQDGKHEGSVITAQTVESLSTDEEQIWRIIRKELEDIGITVAAFDANKVFIMNWFKAATAAGAFEEKALEDTSSSQVCEDNLGQLWEDPQYATTSQFVTKVFDPLAVKNTLNQNPVTKMSITQKATSFPAFLPTGELGTNIKTRKAPHKALTRRERGPRVAALIAWVFRYNKELINTASEGLKAEVQLLLEKGTDVNARDKGGMTALHWVSYKGHETVAQLLLEKGANVNAVNCSDGSTALHYAVERGHEVVAQLLLEKGANVNAVNCYNGKTVLHYAANGGHKVIAQLLLEKGVDTNIKEGFGKTALHWAAEKGDEAVAQLLLEKGAYISMKDKYDGRTALHYAAERGHESVVQLLLEKGADINTKDWKDGRTALHWAAENGHEVVAQLLLEKGANANANDKYKMTTLVLATRGQHIALVWLLLKKGADVNAKDKDERTALHWAVITRQEAVARLLLERGADANATDILGRRALHYARDDETGELLYRYRSRR